MQYTPDELALLEAAKRLRNAMTAEQILRILQALGTAQERAITRSCQQSVEVHFGDGGKPRHINITDRTDLKPK